jgi:polysaccharide export outer membrane protein
MRFSRFETCAFSRAEVFVALLLFWAAALSSPIIAQPARGLPQQDRPPTQTSPPEQGAPAILADSSKDYLISPGDVIEIRVEDAPELSHHYRVSATGDIEIPVLGRIVVMQKTTYELGRLIANMLREQEYLKTPIVVVNVRQYNSRAFFIQGAVGRPGLYQLEGRPSLLTLIGLAGGLADNHGSTVFILRPSKTQKSASGAQDSNMQGQAQAPAPTPASDRNQASLPRANEPDSETAADYELIKVNLSALYKGQFDQNQRLEPGDIVNIPRSDVFFVAGEVRAPGSFPLKDGTTLRQAISLAQGMTFKAKPSRGIIFREDPVAGSRQEIKVDIGAVMDGKKEDIVVRANDVIIIPNSRMKSVGGALLMTFGVNSIRFPMPY